MAGIRSALAAAEARLPDPGERCIQTIAFLAHAVSVVRSQGFRRGGEEDATWRTALARLEQGVEPAGEDFNRARAIRDWAIQAEARDRDGYRPRLAACLERERMTSRELALAASAIRAYNRQLYWQIRRERATGRRK